MMSEEPPRKLARLQCPPTTSNEQISTATIDSRVKLIDWRILMGDALLSLSAVISPSEVKDALSRAIQIIIVSSRDVCLHWDQENQSGNVQSINTAGHLTNGWLKSANLYRSRKIFRYEELSEPDVREFFKNPTNNQYGVLCPVFDQENGFVTALITFTCDSLSDEELRNFDLLEKQITIMFHRLHRLQQNPRISVRTEAPPCGGSAILNLCSELFDQDAGMLQKKVIQFLKKHTGASTGFILMLSQDKTELFCQVIGDRALAEEIRIEVVPGSETISTQNPVSGSPRTRSNVFSDILNEKKTFWLRDIPESKREDLTDFLGDSVSPITSFICVPVTSKTTGDVMALACMVNRDGDREFSEENVNIIQECFQYISSVLTSSVAFQTERRLKNQTQTMLEVAMNIFRKLDDLTVLLREIMQEARNLTNAERCSVFLLEEDTNELVAKVFDGLPTASIHSEQPVEIRIPVTQGIAGYVATTGEMLNIVDAYSHPLFYRGVDEETGFRTRNILCFPIKDEKEKIVGVAQLCNKTKGTHFTSFDEDIAKAFAVYCCISIVHSLMYKKVQDAQHRSKLANELMTYHMQVNEERVQHLTQCEIVKTSTFLKNFDKFESVPRSVSEQDSPLATISMFDELGFISRWRIPRGTLARFVLMVRRGYRDPPYHNWAHAFSVAQFVFLCAKNLPLSKNLTDLELFALFVASLCHDIDHRGTNNSFQMTSQSVLAALYSSEGSVLERHHFSQTICILNTEGCNIFENLSRPDYYRVLDLVRDIILATDLAHHLTILKDLRQIGAEGYNPDSPEQHNLLLCLLMTSADLSDQTKTWDNTRTVAELIYNEFFSQGDLEKALGQRPAEQMDRERACVPDLQISFLDGIALPCYQVLATFFKECDCMVATINKNRNTWQRMSDRVKRGKISGRSDQIFSIDLDSDDENQTH